MNMALFKKREKKKEIEVPELPKLPEFPDKVVKEVGLPEIPEKSSLPAFPESDLGEELGQKAIKAAVSAKKPSKIIPAAPLKEKTKELPEIEGKIGTFEMPEWAPKTALRKIPMAGAEPKKKEPLFIRLDEFEKAISSFDEIKLRISEIEDVLRKIRETKVKEEREVDEWEKEVQTIKTRLMEIDKELFSKV